MCRGAIKVAMMEDMSQGLLTSLRMFFTLTALLVGLTNVYSPVAGGVFREPIVAWASMGILSFCSGEAAFSKAAIGGDRDRRNTSKRVMTRPADIYLEYKDLCGCISSQVLTC
jgi:hypothetical protein